MTTLSSEPPQLTDSQRMLLRRRLAGLGEATAGDILPTPAGGPAPLSPVQHGLWVVNKFLDDNALYSVHRGLWLRGHLDVGALRSGLDELVARHEILRTVFTGDPDPVQLAHDREADFAVVDAGDRAVELAGAELRAPFDLEDGPLFRARLFRVDSAEHLLVLNMHHLVTDGWSCGVLGRELGELYSAAVNGRAPELAPPAIQYRDYARWQAERVTGQVRDEQLAHWREALAGIQPVLRLPTDRPHPPRPSYRTATVTRALPPELTAKVRGLARKHGVTMFVVLLAAFTAVLRRCAGQDSFAVGSLTAGRDRAEVEQLVGLFANTVAIPADLTGDPTFVELLDRTRRAVLGAVGHQDVSFEDVVAAVAPPRETGRNPLFQVLFQYVESDEERWRFAGLDVTAAELRHDLGKVDLALFCVDHDDHLELAVEYALDLFDPDTAARHLARVVAVLEHASTDPGARLSDVDVLPAVERDLVVHGWNDTAMDVPRVTLGELFEAAVVRSPDAPALVDVDGSVTTYAELNRRANRLAYHLRDRGVGRESIVGVCVESGVDMFVALLGVVKSGGAYLPLDPEHPTDRLGYMLDDTGAEVVVTQDHLTGVLPGFAGDLVLLDGVPAGQDTDLPPVHGPDNLVYVMYTSGSTGRPKGVMISHHGLINYLWWAVDGYGLDGASGAPMLGSIAFDLSVPNFFLPLIGGKDVTLLPPDRGLSALAGLLTETRDFSLLKLTPGHLDVLRATIGTESTVDSVRTFVVGADEVRPETVAAWRKIAPDARIIDEYGPTETVVGCSVYTIDDDFDPSMPVSIGRPIANTRMYVLDEQSRPLPVGAVGELCIGGFGVARGYWRRPGLTAEKFVPDPFGEPGTRMYRTGDLARFRADGNLDFLGRADHQVKIRGYRVELGEIEARLLLHPGVSEAVVDARADARGQRRLVAYLVGDTVDTARVREFVAEALPEYMVPTAWVVLDRMPLTQAGKVNRKDLPDPAPAATTTAPDAGPRTETERHLAEVWAEVLGVDRVGIHDDFFQLGGDSILAIHIAAQARTRDVHVTVRQLFEHRTVATLAAAARHAVAPAPSEQGPVTGAVPLTPILRWFTDNHGGLDHYNQSVLLECVRPVSPAALSAALSALVTHHDALRLRLSCEDGWRADIGAPAGYEPLRVLDLSAIPAAERDAVATRLADEVQSGLSVAEGRLVGAALLTGDDRRPDRLLIAIHHIAVDAVSWHTLLADLATACQQHETGQPIALPDKTTSYREWANRVADRAGDPGSPRPDHGTEADTETVEVALSAEVTRRLVRQAPAAYRTEINDLLLTALAHTLTEWAGTPVVTVDLEGHGRDLDDVDLSRTVGWFTSLTPVTLPAPEHDRGAHLKTVKEILRANPAPAEHPPVASFNYVGRTEAGRSGDGWFRELPEPLGADRAATARRPYPFEIDAAVHDGQLRVSWGYSRDEHDRDAIRRLAGAFTDHLAGLVAHCVSGVDGVTPSDFPLAGLDQSTLDGLVTGLAVRPAEIADIYPLSPLQQGMLFRALYDPDSRDYFEQNSYVLHGSLDVDAFLAAWQHVVDRHTVLRSRFVWAGVPRPVQVVSRRHEIDARRLDWTGTDPAAVSDRFDELTRADRAAGIDLTAEYPCRLTVVTTGPDTHHVLWTFHHIVLDAWSVSAVLDEVFTAYQQIRDGRTPELPDVVPYRDYVAWIEGQDRKADEKFWRAELAGRTGPTILPSSGDPEAGPGVGMVRRRLPGELAEDVRRLALRTGCTVGTVMQAAWAVLLSRHTGESDVLFGTIVTGRAANLPGIERMVGLLVNTLPTRVDADPRRTVSDFLTARHDKEMALREHEHSALFDIQHHTDIPTGTPMFENIFVYENFPAAANPVTGMTLEPYGDVIEQTDCPLVVEVNHHDALEIMALHHLARYDRDTCARMLAHFENLVRGMVESPNAPLWQLATMPAGERDLVVHGWNDTAMDVPRVTLGELFEESVARTPDAPALVDVDGSVTTYAELNARANRLAHHLRDRGVTCESMVGVCVESGVDMFVAVLGVVKSGGAYVPLDPEYPAERLGYMIADTGTTLVVTHDRVTGVLPEEFDGDLVSLDHPEIDACPDTNPVPVHGPDNLVWVMYTSGSTGRPKGVMTSHHGVINYLWWALHAYGFDGASGAPMLGSLAFDLSVSCIYLPLIAGKDVTLLPADRSFSALAERLTRPEEDFSLVKLTPGHLDLLRATIGTESTVDSVRRFVVGGDEVRPETVVAWRKIAPNALFVDEYGPTETVVGCSAYTVGDDFDPSVPMSIGKPIGNTRMYVLDEYLDPVPAGVVGELCIGGFGVSRGYWRRPGLSAEKFVPDPFGPPGTRMYRTGDVARFRLDGNIDFLGRRDHQVKIRGYRVELGEIEARLLLYPGVSEAVVDARPDATGHRRLVAYLVAEEDKRLDTAAVTEFAAATLPDYMVPSTWIVLDAMPLTQIGKVDRRSLPDPGRSASTGAGRVAPRTDTERRLAQAWADVLGVDRIGVDDDFFRLGGDSILAIQVVGRVRQAGTAVTLRQVFEHRTIARVAEAVAADGVHEVHAEQGTVTGPVPLTPIVRRFTEQHGGLDHYNQSALFECRTVIDPATLSAAFSALLDHHDALRTRLSTSDGQWQDEITGPRHENVLRVVDLSGLPAAHRDTECESVADTVQSGLSLADGRLVAAALFTGDDRHADRLLVVIHHIAVDTVSWPVLLEDLATAYTRLAAGQPVALPRKTTSFRHWATRLATHRPAPAHRRAAQPLPVDHEHGPNTEASARELVLTLPTDVATALSADRIEVNDILVTALATTLTEWTGTDEVLVDVERHGREPLFDDVDLSRTVGWFTTLHTFAFPASCDLDRVAGLLRDPAAERTGVAPPIVFNYHGRHQQTAAAGPFVDLGRVLGRERDPRATRPYQLDVDAVIAGGELRVHWTYSTNLYREDTVAGLGQRYLDHVRAIVAARRPTDFPLSGLAEAELNPLRSPEVEDIYPLSAMQAGMLVETLGAAGADPYYLQWHLDLDGELDVDAFTRAWRHVIGRHPILRSRFAWEGLAHPVQLVCRPAEVPLEFWDATDVPDQAAWLDRLAADERAEGVDPRAVPTRLVLVRMGARRHRLIWSCHHIQLDRWSRDLVDDELFTTYRALTSTGRLPSLPAPVAFRDVIEWTGRQDGGAEYWRAEFAGFTGPTPAPRAGDTGEPAGMGVSRLLLPAALGTELPAAARRHGVTASTITQAAWALLLSGATGRHDVAIDLTVAGRFAEVPGIERVVGMLINTVPARVRVDPARPVGDWLREMHDQQMRRHAHEHHSLVDIHRWAGIPGDRRMFDTRFVFESPAVTEEVPPGGLTVTDVSDVNGDIEHAVVLAVSGDAEWEAQLRYDRARYDAGTAEELLAEYATVLGAVVAGEPGAPLGTLTRLSEVDSAPAVAPALVEPRASVAPDTPAERTLAEIWRQVLEVETVGVRDDFFGLGGNSILVFRVAALAQQAGLDVTVRQALRHRTIAELAGSLVEPGHGPAGTRLPLTPAQYELVARGAGRTASTRLVAFPSDPAAAARSLRELVARHDALRLRLAGEPGDRWLEVAEPGEPRLIDLTGAGPVSVDDVAADLAAGLDLPGGVALAAALLADPDGARLLLVANRYAVDDASWPVLLADLAALHRGEDLPAAGSYRRWAGRLHDYAASRAFADLAAFWLADRPAPVDLPAAAGATRSVRTATGMPDRADEVVLTAVARALSRWTGSPDVLVDVVSDGRDRVSDDLDPGRTVGAFGLTRTVQLHLPDGDPARVLAAVTAQLRAEPHGALGHGMARWLCEDTAAVLAARPKAQVVFHHGAAATDHLIAIGAEVTGGELVLTWTYHPDVHDEPTIRRVAGYCLDELTAMVGDRPLGELAALAGNQPVGEPGEASRLLAELFPHCPALIVPMARHRVPGVGVALLDGDRITAWGQGVTGGEASVPVTQDTLFPACSVSKQVTTLAVLRLVQEGRLDLHTDVRRYLTSWQVPDGDPITLHTLLSHTAGLTAGDRHDHPRTGPVPGLASVLDRIVRDRPVGAGFHYSNAHFAVVQQVLVDVTGREIAELLHELVLDPLGMHDSGFAHDFANSRVTAHGHDTHGRAFPGGWRVTPELAGSGLWSTPGDLARIGREVARAARGDRAVFLSRELAELMVEPVMDSYGLGTACAHTESAHWFGHPGDRLSHQAFTATDLDSGAGLVVMANIGGETPFLADVITQLRLGIYYLIG